MIWAPPRALFDTATAQGETRSLKWKSIGELFPTMVQQENLNVVYNYDVVNIKRKCFNRLEVESFDGETQDFDYVFWSGLPKDFQKVAHVCYSFSSSFFLPFSIHFYTNPFFFVVFRIA